MNDLSDIYENRIKSLTKDQFDVVVKSYIKSKWHIQEVIFTDGSHDGGVDIRIIENEKRKRIPIQVTIDKNTYKKLERDLVKIEKLISDHNYSDTFNFFYSGNSAESKLNDLEDAALELGFNLKIIDAKEIAGIANSNLEIRNAINSFLNINEPLIFSDFDKMKFDLLSYGNTTTEIKEKFAQSLIISELYEKHTVKIADLKTLLSKSFEIQDEKNFSERQINKLRTKKIIFPPKDDKDSLLLSDDERRDLDVLKKNLDIEEKSFIDQVKKVLEKNNIKDRHLEVIEKFLQFYKSNNSKDIDEITEKITNDCEITAIGELRNYINSITKVNADSILRDLFLICSNNTLLQRISASNLFTKLLDNPLLVAYINQQPKPVYLDTPILLHLLCVYYNPRANYDNVYYKIAQDFNNYFQNGDIKMKLHTIKDYISEVAFQIEEAFMLLPFIEKGFYESFGSTSNNVFFNFYKNLVEEENLEPNIKSFANFMNDFGFNFDPSKEKPIDILIEDICYLLESNGVDIIPTKDYKRDFEWKEVYAVLQREIEDLYNARGVNRSPTTLKHDLHMLIYLFDKKNHTIDPTFVTWDNTFFEIRKSYHKNHANAAYWHLFRPAKLIDHFSLLFFKINSNNLSHSIYSILESDYDLKAKISGIQDTLLRIVDLETTSGVKFAKELKELRTEHIYGVTKKVEKGEVVITLPIDLIFIKISNHFFKQQSKYKVRDFKTVLNSENSVDLVIELLKFELSYYKKNSKISDDLLERMDKLIETSQAPGK